jgi:hypothetical protein
LLLLWINGPVDEGCNDWLHIIGVELAIMVIVILNVGHHSSLGLRINVLGLRVQLHGGRCLVLRLLVNGMNRRGGLELLLLLAYKGLNGHGRILWTRRGRVFLLLDGLADEANRGRALLLMFFEALAKLAHL